MALITGKNGRKFYGKSIFDGSLEKIIKDHCHPGDL